jgi:hypothetical protein
MKKIHLIGAVAAAALAGQFAMASIANAEPPKRDPAKFHESMCTDRYAREVGRLSYLETKLAPTAAQKSAWNKYKSTVESTAKASETKCLARPARNMDGKRPSIVERQAMQQSMLESRLQTLKATQPALTALYASLNDEQKMTLDRSDRGGMGGHRMGGKRDHHRGDWGKHRGDDHRGGGPKGDAPKPVEN